MGGNGEGGRGTGRFWVSGSNWVSGGGGGIYTVDASIKWAKTDLATNLTAYVNGESGRTVVSAIVCATTTLNASSLKWSDSGASKTWTENRSVMVVSPVILVVAASALSPPKPSVSGRRRSGVWSFTLLMLMVATFMSPPPSSNFATTKVLRIPNAVAFGPISTSRTVQTIIMVFLFTPYRLKHSASEVTWKALVYILVLIVQRGLVGAIASVFFVSFSPFFESCIFVPLCTSTAKKGTHTNWKSPNIPPMRFEGMMILNLPIKFPHFAILQDIEGGSNSTSIEEKHLTWGVW